VFDTVGVIRLEAARRENKNVRHEADLAQSLRTGQRAQGDRTGASRADRLSVVETATTRGACVSVVPSGATRKTRPAGRGRREGRAIPCVEGPPDPKNPLHNDCQ
jgi:hypothetical protein